jgi:GNAT superfamily N-acetyltransferase
MDRDIETHALPLFADATYHWDLYVASEGRRSGVGTALAFARLHRAHEQSCRIGWRLIDIDNGRSWSRFSSDTVSPETAATRAALEHVR